MANELRERLLLSFLHGKRFYSELDRYASWYCPELITRHENSKSQFKFEEQYIAAFLSKMPSIINILSRIEDAEVQELLIEIRTEADNAVKAEIEMQKYKTKYGNG